MGKTQSKDTSWIKFRHRVVTAIVRAVIRPYCRWKYGITVTAFKEQGDRKYLILYNHQTGFDQFFVALAFRGPVYYVATEDIFSLGWISSMIRWLVAPIPIKKQATDMTAVKNCIRIAKEGGTISMAPEGNRTYSGRTEHMNPAVAGLARKLKLPIALLRIEGGYGVQPRWSDVIRKGRMRAYVSEVIEPEDYAQLTNEELLQRIQTGLHVDENVLDSCFEHPQRAEYLERAMYVCPTCGLTTFESHGDIITCQTCGMQVRYETTKELTGVGADFPFRFAGEWYDHQTAFINALDPAGYLQEPMYRDQAAFSEVILRQRKDLLRAEAQLALYGDRIVVDEMGPDPLVLRFEDITAMSVLGKNKVNIYHLDRVYQLKGDARFNGLKYVNIYYRWKNVKEGKNEQFLGL